MVEWKKLGEFAQIQKKKNKDHITENAYSITQNGLVPTNSFFKEKTRITSSDTKGYYIVEKDWFVYSPSRIDVGSINYIKDEGPVIVSPIDVVFSINKNVCLPSYLLQYFMSHNGKRDILRNRLGVEGTGRRSLPFTAIQNMVIPVPTLEEQNRIVGILDTFTDSIENLKQQISQRRKQYEHYRDQLLIFQSDINWYELIELCDYVDYRGKTPTKVAKGVFLVTAKNIRKGYIDYENSKEIYSFEDYEIVMRRGKPKKGDVLITTEAPCGNVALVDDDSIALAQRVIKYRPKDKRLNSSYLKYVLLGTDFQIRLDKEATGATAKGIKGSKLHKLKIPLPSIEEQSRIVSILDTFEASISNLEAQLAQRQKQYKYYRNQLLTFE